jgi:hypothetical protein
MGDHKVMSQNINLVNEKTVLTQKCSVFPQNIHVFPPKIIPVFYGKLLKISTKCRLSTKISGYTTKT